MRGELPREWLLAPLGNLAADLLSGGTPSTKRTDYWSGTIPWITSKWLGERLRLLSGEKYISPSALANSASNVVPAGNLIYGTRVGVGKVAVNEIDVAINQDLTGIVVDQRKALPEFLAYQLRTDRVKSFVDGNKRGATIQGITKTCVREIEIALPPLEEQRQIAAVLSTVQQAIERQERLIALTAELKKALMHKLFTEGTRGEPLKQTEIGPVPQSWEIVLLGSIAKIGNGSTPKRDNVAYWKDGTIPWLTSGKIHEGRITEPDQYVTETAKAECHLPLVAGGSLLVAITGEGKTLGNAALVEFDTCVSQHLAYVQFQRPDVLPAFLLYFLQRQYAHLRLMSVGAGSTKRALTCGLLKRYEVPMAHKSEQKLIASALDAVVVKLKVQERLADSLRTLFRTLLHQLMTAQIRVHDLDLSALEDAEREAVGIV